MKASKDLTNKDEAKSDNDEICHTLHCPDGSMLKSSAPSVLS